ncbi:MAG TPA: DUF2065 domain-containing protein [Rubrivivax sp.]|nr:DUF2065 domain-containing protein [Rubrivivax sp.]
MGELLFGALALMLVFEGLLPFVSPTAWRRAFERALKLSNGQIRFLGMAAIVVGLLLLSIWQ